MPIDSPEVSFQNNISNGLFGKFLKSRLEFSKNNKILSFFFILKLFTEST